MTLCIAASGITFSAIYSLWLFNRLVFGTLKLRYFKVTTTLKDIDSKEFIVLLSLLVPTIFFGLSGMLIFDLTYYPIQVILYGPTENLAVLDTQHFSGAGHAFLSVAEEHKALTKAWVKYFERAHIVAPYYMFWYE